MIKKIIRYVFFAVFIILLVICVFHKKDVQAVNLVDGIENFPESYQGYLEELKKQHPNWS